MIYVSKNTKNHCTHREKHTSKKSCTLLAGSPPPSTTGRRPLPNSAASSRSSEFVTFLTYYETVSHLSYSEIYRKIDTAAIFYNDILV